MNGCCIKKLYHQIPVGGVWCLLLSTCTCSVCVDNNKAANNQYNAFENASMLVTIVPCSSCSCELSQTQTTGIKDSFYQVVQSGTCTVNILEACVMSLPPRL